MASFPHQYKVATSGGPDGELPVDSNGLPTLATTAPPEFGGPAGYWSPETLLTGAVASCLILTFRALARARKLEWTNLEVDCSGEVDKTREGLKFTKFRLDAVLTVAGGADENQAREVLENAKKHCLVTASLTSETEMTAEVRKG
ncbi:MAG: OsmC family protein [Gammaproteobacteria bacterium]|nr:OsmC family protein [Gammaproteobacteria bacterium]